MGSTGSSSNGAVPDSASGAVVVGLVTYQDAATIGMVAAAARDGLAAYFADTPTRIILADAGSTDGTVTRAREALGGANFVEVAAPLSTADFLDVPYHGIPGKARVLHSVLTQARDLTARACVIVDGSIRTVTPDWIAALARPVVDGECDLVSPFYRRHAFEGALTKGVIYPVIRALYGVRFRQPAAAEFGCSGQLVDRLLHEDVWERSGSQVGIDIWLATATASTEFRLGEAALGVRAHGSRGEEALDLSATIVQVVGALFLDVERRAGVWQRQRQVIPVQQLGAVSSAPLTGHSPIDAEPSIDAFRLGFQELRDIWTWVLPPRTIVDLKKLLDCPADRFRLDDQLWARIIYDFAVAFRLRTVAREHLLRSLVPLYSGWLASYLNEVREADPVTADVRVDALAEAFETQKPYLIARWRWPERLRTG